MNPFRLPLILVIIFSAPIGGLTTAPASAQPMPIVDRSIRLPTEVESPTGQIQCQTVIEAEIEAQAIAAEVEFVYPQLRSAEYLNVQISFLGLNEVDPAWRKAWFSTAGEDSYWTVPVVLGVAPVVITLSAAPRDPVNDRFLAEFSGHAVVPVQCEPL